MSAQDAIVIVGAGQAGAVAARSLREMGYTGALTIVGDEVHLPYERPPLSKEALRDGVHGDIGQIHNADFYLEQNIQHLGGIAAQKIDRDTRNVILQDGRHLPYSACVIATGGRARRIPLFPDAAPQVHTLRTLDDALALKKVLSTDTHLVVIGGGFLGLEAAWTAKQKGSTVTVIEAGNGLLSRIFPSFLSEWLLQRALALGINVCLNAKIVSAEIDPPSQGVIHVVLEDGQTICADKILVAVGLVPETLLANTSGLLICDKTQGILVDEQCRTSDARIWAAGDCASQQNVLGQTPNRRESWQNANVQGETVAASILSRPLPVKPYPWFWTDQLDCNIQLLGQVEPDLQYVLRGELSAGPDQGKCICLGLRQGKPVYGVAINAGADLRTLRPLFEQGIVMPTEPFSDLSVLLKPFVKSCLPRLN